MVHLRSAGSPEPLPLCPPAKPTPWDFQGWGGEWEVDKPRASLEDLLVWPRLYLAWLCGESLAEFS